MSCGLKRALVISSLLLAPTVAWTYSLLQPARHWASKPVPICVVGPGHVSITANDLDGGITATIQALNGNHPKLANTGWNVMQSIGTVVQADACPTVTWRLGDGQPTIAFDEKIRGTCTGSCLAATFTGFYHCDPALPDGHCVIDDSDVETRRNKADPYGGPYYSLNESSCTSGREWNIEGIMVHEVGHVLGIGHSNVSGSTMYPSVSSCRSAPATIENDDRFALDALY